MTGVPVTQQKTNKQTTYNTKQNKNHVWWKPFLAPKMSKITTTKKKCNNENSGEKVLVPTPVPEVVLDLRGRVVGPKEDLRSKS